MQCPNILSGSLPSFDWSTVLRSSAQTGIFFFRQYNRFLLVIDFIGLFIILLSLRPDPGTKFEFSLENWLKSNFTELVVWDCGFEEKREGAGPRLCWEVGGWLKVN